MRRFLYFTTAAVLGAGTYVVYHRLSGSRESLPDDQEAMRKAETALAAVEPPPIPSAELGSPASPPRSPRGDGDSPGETGGAVALEEVPPPPGGASDRRAAPAAPAKGESEGPPALPSSGSFDPVGKTQLAEAAFGAGDTARGVKLLYEVFREGKERPDADLVPLARKVLQVEAGGEPVALLGPAATKAERLDLYRYLAARDGDPVWRFRALYGLGSIESSETGVESLQAAWDHLSQAYLIAGGPSERREVMVVLDPFLKRQVFSKRFSPLLSTYTVKGGDSLNRISKSRLTTEEAIQRLNQLTDTVIHPGQRLLILEGKSKIFVKKSDFRLALMVGERLLLEFPVGLGRDNSTPAALFVVRVRQKDPIWYRRGEPPIPAGDPRNILGPRWLGFKDTEELSGFGIHGTTDLTSIGKEDSSGCIRMDNRDLEVLWDFVPLGTEVQVME